LPGSRGGAGAVGAAGRSRSPPFAHVNKIPKPANSRLRLPRPEFVRLILDNAAADCQNISGHREPWEHPYTGKWLQACALLLPRRLCRTDRDSILLGPVKQ
jgi:hypothetical protein